MSIIERAANKLNRDNGNKNDAGDATAARVLPDAGQDTPAQPARHAADRIAAAMARRVRETAMNAPPAASENVQVATPGSTPVASAASVSAPPPPVAIPAAPAPPLAPNMPGALDQVGKITEINLARLGELGFITAGGGRSLIAEQFRMIKRALIRKAFEPAAEGGNPNNLIMVTSSLPGEGKTFCSVNLAMSIAMELDHTVLLVDVDVARPNVLRTLGIEPKAGLMDVLLDERTDIVHVMLKTNVDTLSILPSGRSHPHAAELLASQSMQSMLEEIASRYPDRIVIFDSPPLLMTSEARMLAAKMGQIVFIVEAEKTTHNAVKSALEQLKGCSNINLLYNKSGVFPGEGYGYGYGYGTYY